jgi:CRISPR/Cas system-associated endonuclease Cas1
MYQDLYTKLYIRASENNDKDLIDFLEVVSQISRGHKENLQRLGQDLKDSQEETKEALTRIKRATSLDEVRRICGEYL